jgi:hypothetical protein
MFKMKAMKLGIVIYAYNSTSRKAEIGRIMA